MTDLHDSPTSSPSPPGRFTRKRKLQIAGGVVVVGIAVVAFLAYWFIFRDNSAASVDTEEAEQARQEALAEVQDDPPAPADADAPAEVQDDPPAPADADPPADATGAAAGIDGTWSIDTSIGTFDNACLTEVCNTTFVGFRIDEELATIGAKTVVGRTPGVSGTMEIEGTTILSTDVMVDMTGLITDDPSRTNAIRRQAIETNDFPEASFTLTQPIELGAIPADGEQIQIEATGDLTIHGVTRTETIPLTAELAGDVIVVFGQLGPILLADYDIDQPRAAVVLSVEDNAIMELQLFLTRG